MMNILMLMTMNNKMKQKKKILKINFKERCYQNKESNLKNLNRNKTREAN